MRYHSFDRLDNVGCLRNLVVLIIKEIMGKGLHLTPQEYEALCKRLKVKSLLSVQPVPEQVKESKPKKSKTEMEFENIYLRNKPHKFQPFTFHMENGLRYRPDFYTPEDRTFYEIKGGYRLHSHGRSMLAFNQCRVEFPEFTWKLAIKTKDAGWAIK